MSATQLIVFKFEENVKFQKVRTGNFDLTKDPRGRHESEVINDVLMITIESDPFQNASEFSLKVRIATQTILTSLAQTGKLKWVLHELNEKQKHERLEACLMLLSPHKSGPFLNRTITCDEKWIQSCNRKRAAQGLDGD